jgi:hypothetical protein
VMALLSAAAAPLAFRLRAVHAGQGIRPAQ